MSDAISVKGLSKSYVIGHIKKHGQLRESLMDAMRPPFLRKKPQMETIWALRDVSFSIEPGETVGIIGRNGAGKSTLLKILSKITYPTTGQMKVNGKVASLLEVGTGFHPELTGRENIYMNGSILGMSKKEVDRKFDQIVEFSGVEKFLDTPIKRYSSGMRLRLGFSVAAHLDPNILVVDEVLAVGDAAFQKKCLNTMANLREEARTVLFVSHNLAAVENLCKRCIWIDDGRVRMDGESHQVIKAYMENMAAGITSSDFGDVQHRRGNGKIRFRSVEFLSPEGDLKTVIRAGDSVLIRFHYSASEPIVRPDFGFRMYTEMGTLVTQVTTGLYGIVIPLVKPGEGFLDLEIDCLNLLPAKYTLSLGLTDPEGVVVYDVIEHAIAMVIETSNIFQSGKEFDSRLGIVFFPQRWDLSGILGTAQHSRKHPPSRRESLSL
jgi:homopolymeric O-antigen transport system ATP-binding protein